MEFDKQKLLLVFAIRGPIRTIVYVGASLLHMD